MSCTVQRHPQTIWSEIGISTKGISRVRKSKHFPDSNVFSAKTLRIKHTFCIRQRKRKQTPKKRNKTHIKRVFCLTKRNMRGGGEISLVLSFPSICPPNLSLNVFLPNPFPSTCPSNFQPSPIPYV